MRLALMLALAAAIVGCDDPAPESRPDIAPDPPEEPAPEEEAVPPPLEDPAPAPVTFTVPEDPDGLPELTLFPPGRRITTRGGGWQVPQLADEVVRERVGMLFAHIGYANGITEAFDENNGYWDEDVEEYGGCRPVLATDRVVSAVCYGVHLYRGGGAANEFRSTAHFALTDGQAIPFAMEDVLVEGATLAERITEEVCVEDQLRQGIARMPAIRSCRPSVNTPEQWVLGADGFVHPYQLGQTDPPTITVAYAAVRDALREDGPIAWVFEAGRPVLWASEDDATGLAVTKVLPYAELLTRAAALDDETLASVKVQDFDGMAGRLVFTSSDALAEARALAETLGGEVHRARWEADALRSLSRVRTSDNTNLYTAANRAGRWGSVRRTIPNGMHLLALATADGTLPETTLVGGRPELIGYVSGAAITAHTGCRADPSAFLESFPEDAREAATERLHVARSTVRTDPQADARTMALFASSANQETRIRLAEMDDACAVGEVVFEETIPGNFFDVRMGTSERDGAGESFLLVGIYRGERLRTWAAYRISNGRRIFSHTPEREELVGNQASFEYMVTLGGLADRDDESSWAPLLVYGDPYRWNGRLVRASGE